LKCEITVVRPPRLGSKNLTRAELHAVYSGKLLADSVVTRQLAALRLQTLKRSTRPLDTYPDLNTLRTSESS
jgi:hypothetical protein